MFGSLGFRVQGFSGIRGLGLGDLGFRSGLGFRGSECRVVGSSWVRLLSSRLTTNLGEFRLRGSTL